MNLSDQFGIVEPGIYRCSSSSLQWPPHPYVKFKTVLLLSPELSKNQAQTFSDRQVNLIHLGVYTGAGGKTSGMNYVTSWRPISDEVIKEGLQVVLNQDTHPILICCTSGILETSLLVGCLRKLQGWNYNSIVVEYRIWAGNKSKYAVEQYIELFDVDLVTIPVSKTKSISS